MIAYDQYAYLWPPRPENKIPPTALAFYQNKGFWSQTKKNGTCTVIFSNGKEVIFKTRHNDDHKLWTPQEDHKEFFSVRRGWNVYTGELLHSKVTGGPKNELYLFDILVSDGQYLIDSTFAERQDLLHKRWNGKFEGDRVRVAPRITVAVSADDHFEDRFNNLKREDEGLVLKDPKAKLRPCFKADSNSSWQIKCRIAHKNYSF
jgi:hypothetical protein